MDESVVWNKNMKCYNICISWTGSSVQNHHFWVGKVCCLPSQKALKIS